MKAPTPITPSLRNQGVALLFTLAMIVIVALVVVTYATIVRLETTTARSLFELEQVNQLSTMALDEVTTKLRDNIPLDAKWAVGPGLLYSYDETVTPKPWRRTELHSGAAGTSTTGSVALNAPMLGDASSSAIISPNAEYPDPDPMRVAWINVLQDGTRSTDPGYGSAVSTNNPIIGRYAYWVDTETSKVNLNTAGKAQTDYKINAVGTLVPDADIQNLTGHPSRVDLSQLENVTPTESLATYNFAASSLWYGGDGTDNKLGALEQFPAYRAPGQGMKLFNSIDDWMQIPGITEDKIEDNKFYLTTLARSPELTPWGLNKNWWPANRGPRGPVNAHEPGYENFKLGNQLNIPNAHTVPPSEYGDLRRWAWNSDTRFFVYPPVVSKKIENMQHLGWMAEVPDYADRNTTMQNWMDNMMDLLKRDDWPGMPSKSFVDKYGLEECESLAVNMLYLFASSVSVYGPTAPIVYTNASPPPPNSDSAGLYGSRLVEYTRSDGTKRLLSGVGPWPYLNEVAVSLVPTQHKGATEKAEKDAGGPGHPAEIDTSDPNYATYPKTQIQISPSYERTYPPSLAWDNGWVVYTGKGPLGTVAYSNVEVNASGSLNGSPVTYGYDGVAAPQPTWEKPSGETESQYTWGYPDDDNNRGLGWTPATNAGPNADEMRWIQPSATPLERTLPSLYVGPFDRDSPVKIEVKFRISARRYANAWRVYQLVPAVRDYTNDPDDPADSTKLVFDFPPFIPDGLTPAPTMSLELCDPRLYRYASDWKPSTAPLGNTLGAENSVYVENYTDTLTGVVGDSSKLVWPNIPTARTLNFQLSKVPAGDNLDPRLRQTAANTTSFPGMGWLSVLPTNIESGGTWSAGVRTPIPSGPIPWRTLSLEPAKGNQLPDWLLLDIFTIAYDKTFLSHTQGKINVNSRIEPFGFSRRAPLEALMIPSSDNPTTSAEDIVDQLVNYEGTQDISGSQLPDDMYVYAGQIFQASAMSGSGANQFAREALMRDVANLITTKSSDFKVHLVAQSLIPNRTDPDEPGKVAAEQRMEAIISRVVDVGPDNIPGTDDDMAGPDDLVGTTDDLTFTAWNGSSISKLNYDETDTPLEGFAGTPPVRYQVSHLKVLNP